MINLGKAYRKDEQKTVRATRAVVARQADNEKTNKERTNDGASRTGKGTNDEQ